MSDIQPEGDGCMVCPECGAAWQADAALGSSPEGQP
jgi:hypothetical protein